VKTTVEDSHWN